MLTLFKKIALPFVLISLLISNGLTLFHDSFHSALFAALSRLVPLQWQKHSPTHKHTKNAKHLKTLRVKSKKISQRVSQRTIRNISANIAALPAETLPAVGAGVVIAITAMDLHDACSDLKDMDELSSLFDTHVDTSETSKICGMSLSDK